MLKLNYIDDPNILLGYPIARKSIQLKNRKRLELYPIPELLTYDGFLSQKSLHGHMVRRYLILISNLNQPIMNIIIAGFQYI